MLRILLNILFVILFSLTSCDRVEDSKGPTDIIYVLSSEKAKEVLSSAIDTTFSYGMRVPEFQLFFSTSWHPLKSFKNFMYFKNLIIISDLSIPGIGKSICKEVLPAEQYRLAESETNFLFSREDYWANDQVFILIAGKDFEKMRDAVLQQKGWLFQKFNDKFRERQKKYIFSRYEKKKLSRYLWEKYRWTLRIQHDYLIIREYPEKGFVWLGRGYPYRWVSISWKKGMKTSWLTPNGLFDKRNQIGDLYANIKTDTKFLGHQFRKFRGWDALCMTGVWYHNKEPKGGPFMTYAFYDGKTNRTFAIDILMFAPGEEISLQFRQIEVMAGTFTTSSIKDIFR